jgi:membrane protease YdiL (CAAX protease family)
MVVLAALGLSLRVLLDTGPAFGISPHNALLGLGVVAVVLVSDLILHTIFSLTLGNSYLERYRELAGVFQGQRVSAIVAGATMAGVGEELVFRGLGTNETYLVLAAVLFGCLHHIRRSLGLFTLWAMYEGLLFAGALYLTQMLFVTMVAHFLHDLMGFFVFRHLNRQNPYLRTMKDEG